MARTFDYIEAPNIDGAPIAGTLQDYRRGRIGKSSRAPFARVRLSLTENFDAYLREEMS